ncbi:hypothetical protein DFH08DRAFT_1054510 [Mycena albidolilacea]|uniref:Novel STAND NTPase 1 domain-containing protein n=1 Tax=Mycena albidolilacea TaxID=1033008 RepID=A0AAD6Z4P2_9AGAR|nr:hypothetical protein DFH08DRAFT_1054510 [Mycena albidolilacea]
MPPPAVIQVRLSAVTTSLTITAKTLAVLADTLDTPFLGAIMNTTEAVLKNIETVKQNKDDCVELLEQTHKFLTVIISLYIKSETGAELPPDVLHHIGKFTQYLACLINIQRTDHWIRILHKIHNFIEAHQKGSKIRAFFHKSESSVLLRECKIGLQQGLEFFQTESAMISSSLADMKKDAQKRHQEVLDMIETLSEKTISEQGSMISRPYYQSYSSSNSISMLPSAPKIFHGRDLEVSDILDLFKAKTTRIAILGAGGIGKSSLARVLLHHSTITDMYQQNRFFVGCNSATTKMELVTLIGTHIGLRPSKDHIQAVLKHLSNNPPSLLILDELETLWESTESRGDIEELLSLLTDINHLALMITMRGAERPAKVQWTRPFLLPLKPLDQEAARLTFIDIADDKHDLDEVDEILSLTDYMPLAINLLAHLVDSEGCSNVLLRWKKEKTLMISEGFDKRSNLDLSISLSLSSPRIKSLPQSQELLSLLGMLPDGLSDVDLIQSKLPLKHPLKCKAVLTSTALAYSDENKQLKVLMPIREYVQQHQHPEDQLVHTLLKHFQDLLHLYVEYKGTQTSVSTVNHIASNFANIQNLFLWGLQEKHSNLLDTIRGVCHLSHFHRATHQGSAHLIGEVQHLLPNLGDQQLRLYVNTELLSRFNYLAHDPEALYLKGWNIVNILMTQNLNLLGTFYATTANYYSQAKHDLLEAAKMCNRAISLGISTGYTRGQALGFRYLAWVKFLSGEPSKLQLYAQQSQRFARESGDLYSEAHAARLEAMSWAEVGNYKQSLLLCIRGTNLLALCGMSTSEGNLAITHTQAGVHICKSEYSQARDIYTHMPRDVSENQDHYWHAIILLNVAEMACDAIVAALYAREKDRLPASLLLEKNLKLGDNLIGSFCLEWLANVSQWGATQSRVRWTTVFLVHSVKHKKNLKVHKAIQSFGDLFLTQGDESSAINLFTTALEGFTYMDVHCSRAECMLRLGDISKSRGDPLRAMELWDTARPLFECSSQAQQVENLDCRIAGLGQEIQVQHRENLAKLAQLNAPSGMADEVEDDQADTEDLENMSDNDKRVADVVAS